MEIWNLERLKVGKVWKETANDIETSEFQEAFDGGLESLTIWLEGLPKLQREKVLDLVEQSSL